MIDHYLASNQNSLLFFLIGLSFGIGGSFWENVKQGCLTKIIYIYFFGAWVLSCLIVVFTDPRGLEFLLFGFLTYHIKAVFSWLSVLFFWILDKNRTWKQQEERVKWEQEQDQSHQHQQQDRTEQMRREQEWREKEARQYREQQERAKREQEQARKNSEQPHKKQQEPPPKNPEPARDTRTFEEILGLSSGWTQDDLKTAYKRESQRLHPDKWTGKPANIQTIMEAEFKAVQEAYNRLKR